MQWIEINAQNFQNNTEATCSKFHEVEIDWSHILVILRVQQCLEGHTLQLFHILCLFEIHWLQCEVACLDNILCITAVSVGRRAIRKFSCGSASWKRNERGAFRLPSI